VHDGVLANRERGFATAAPAHVLTPEEMQKRLRSLYQKVIGPMESSLAGAATLYLVPDGKLTVAPISALIDGQGHYVLESRGVSYVDSWRDIYTSVFYGSAPPTSAIIVADPDFNLAFHGDQPAAPNVHRPIFKPLPGAEAEAADTAKELGVAADRVLTGKAARQWLVQSLESPEVLHFATHSVPHLNWKPPAPAYSLFEFPEPTDTEFPLLESVIALAGANRPQQGIEDGLLTGLEVGSLHLDGTRLAVLSSCESGQGSVVDGQGVLGLRAAFSLAGAQATVMTLWPVDDTAGRQFMQFFYARLDKGPAEAVRLAQQQMLATAQYKNPFFWSGYVVSASPVRKTMQSIERKAPPPANATTQKPEVFVTPNCYDITARLAPVGDTGGMVDVRLRIGGVVHRTQISPQQVDYDLTPFGNEIERRESTNYKGGPQVMDPEVQVGSERHWAMDLIVDHEKEKSSVAIRFGSVNAELNQRQLIQLNGGAGLFATTEFPAELPPISSYSSAFYLQGSNQIVSIKPCGATP
jgi:CHAT domain-containing protein